MLARSTERLHREPEPRDCTRNHGVTETCIAGGIASRHIPQTRRQDSQINVIEGETMCVCVCVCTRERRSEITQRNAAEACHESLRRRIWQRESQLSQGDC